MIRTTARHLLLSLVALAATAAPMLASALPTVTTATQSAVTATSATLGGEVTSEGTGAVTDRGIVWATATAPTIANTKVSIGAGMGPFSQTVSGLPAATTIYVRAFATNTVDTAYGTEISFTTPSNNADLSALSLSSGTLDPAFDADETSYTASVATATTSLTVTPTRAEANATIEARINGGDYASVTSGSPSGALALNLGANTIDVRVTAQDTTTQNTYTIIVTRRAVPSITSPTSTAITATTATLGGNVTADGAAAITERGVVYSLTTANNDPLIDGAGVTKVTGAGTTGIFTVDATGLTDGVGYSFKAYAINSEGTSYTSVATFATPSANADLSALSLSSGTLDPAFDADVTSYTASVATATTSVTVTPTRAQADATIEARINGGGYASVTSGSPSGALALNLGANTIDVRVTAQAGNTKTYTVIVTRRAAPSITSPTSTAITATTATLGGNVTADGAAAITERGVVYSLTTANNDPLIDGAGVTKVTDFGTTGIFTVDATGLTDGVGYSFKAYAINSEGTSYTSVATFATPSANADLSNLTLSTGILAPGFAEDVTSYTAVVVTATTSLTATPTRAQADATIEVRVNGGAYASVTSGSPSGALAVNLGPNTVDVRVTAQAGNTQTYSTIVTRNSPPTDISLSNNSIPENSGPNFIVGELSAVDPDADATHVFTLVTGSGSADNASFNLNGNTLRKVTSANFEVKSSYTVRVRADDGLGGVFERSLAITITDVNETPSADNVTAVGDEDATGITVTFLGADPDNDDLTYEIVTPPLPGEGTLGPVVDNTVVFTPAANYNGVVVFTYKALDGEFESASATATVTVNAVNDAPTITDIESLTILEDGNTGELSFTVNDVDAGDSLVVTAYTNNQILAPDAKLVLSGTGANRTITVTPEPDMNGVVTVTVQVDDGLLTAMDDFTLTVTPVNDEPSFTLNPAPILPGANLAEGRLWAWGFNGSGQVGDGSNSSAGIPVQIGSKTDWIEVATGDFYTIALRKDGTLWAWGANGSGQLGQGTNAAADVPVQIGEEDDWKSISAGDGHVLALKVDGTLWAWGNNNYGQTGNGSTSPVLAPVQIGAGTDWHMVSAGGLHSLALKGDGTLWAWGRNQFSQLGNGLTATVTAPAQIGTATDWRSVAAGGTHSVALKQDKTLWAWGRGGEGQIGDGSNNTRTTPKQIGTGTDWESIVTGYTFSAALKDDGTLWAWGRNGDGQVGDGTRFNRNSPKQIGIDDDWAMLAAGRYHALALKIDGTLWAWGDNEYSQLGNDDSADLLVPTQVGTEVWSKIAGGFGHSVAIEPETSRLTIPANSGPFTLLNFATDILAGPIDEIAQNVTFEVTNDDNSLFVAQPEIDEDGTLTLTPGVDEGTMTVTVHARDDGGTANGGDDLSEAKTFSIRITIAPEMDITGNGVEIESGDVTPDPADHTDFEMVPTVGETLTRTFTIVNSGTAPLNLTGVPIVSLSGSAAFTVATQPSLPVVERLGGTQTFSITFDPTAAEVVTATVSIMSDDEDENPYTFTIRGEGITPEIGLTGNATEISNGAETTSADNHTHFGDSPVVGGTVVRTFTIANTGKQDLTLSGSPLVSVSGSADFTVTTQPVTSTVAALTGTTTFQVTFNPSARGTRSATVSIANNDEDEAPFTFAVSGVGTSPEITVYGNGNEIVSGDTTPTATDHTAFGSVGPAMQRTFSIANEGNLELILGTPVVSLSGSSSFSIVTSPPAATSVAPEGSPASFTIAFDPSTPGTQTTVVTVASNDEDESSYTFTIQGTGVPEFGIPTFIGINGGNVVNLASLMGPIPTGGVFSGPGVTNGIFDPNVLDPGEYTLTYTIQDAAGGDFSINFDVTVELLPARITVDRPRKFKTTELGRKSPPQTIVITNAGKATLTGLRFAVTGKGKKDYEFSKVRVTTLEGKRSTALSVVFAPRGPGSRTASVTFVGDGVAPVKITLKGVGKRRGGPLNPRFQ